MYRFEGQKVNFLRGDAARALAQRTIFSARRVLPEFNDVTSPMAVRRCAHLLRTTLGEPSYVVHRSFNGPVEVWVIALKNGNGILSFELWLQTSTPRFYVFTDRPTPIVAKLLKRLQRVLFASDVISLSERDSSHTDPIE